MKSILNKSYHHSRALWSSFVICGCGCIFNFLSIKSKYTPLSPLPLLNPNKRSQHEQTGEEYSFLSANRLYISLLMRMMEFNRQIHASMPSITHTHEFGRKKISCSELGGRDWTTATQHKLSFIIKWLLIHISCSHGSFDQSKTVTGIAFFLIFWLLIPGDITTWQQFCVLTVSTANYLRTHVTSHLFVVWRVSWLVG